MSFATTVTTPEDSRFPPQLHHVDPKPSKLYQKGNFNFNQPLIAIVGSRKYSSYGQMVVETIVEHLAQFNVTIVSGLALGIDSLAHKAALQNNLSTIAVLPGGIEKVYPASHQHLARAILEAGGALLSEHSGMQRPYKSLFPQRNRIISGLSQAVIVAEAAERSGSLITARLALEQGKELMAVPGPINSPTSQGTNTLIKSGAHIISEPRDVTDVLGLQTPTQEKKRYDYSSKEEEQIHQLLQQDQLSGDVIMKQLQIDHQTYLRSITMLELRGYVMPLGGDRWAAR